MESKTTKTFADSIVVFPEDLRYFDDSLRKNFNKIEYEATCEDGTKIKPFSLNELLEYENPNFKRIASITINALDEKLLDDNVEIIMGKAGSFSSDTGIARFKFKDIKQQYPIEDEVLKHIKAIRPWYYWLNKISFKLFLPLLLIGVGISLDAISLFKKLFGSIPAISASPSKFTDGESNVLTVGVFGILFIVGYLIDRSRDYLFPKYFFCIGRQQKEFERRRKITYFIFGVIILGIIINIISAVIYNPFLK